MMKTVIYFIFALLMAASAGASAADVSTGTVSAVRPSVRHTPRRKAAPAPQEVKKDVRVQTVKNDASNVTGIAAEQSFFAPGASKGQGPAKLSESGADQSGEDGGVMIDARSDEAYSGRVPDNEPAAAEDTETPAVPGGLPVSYGQLKGTLNDGGRSLLVFENDNGTISFVQITAGKNTVSWKLVSRIHRSAD
jgi:hypothetical protein